MNYTIREMFVLTAYAALLVTNVDAVATMVSIACVATTMVIGAVFGAGAVSEIARGKQPGFSRAFAVPMGLMFFCIIPAPMIAIGVALASGFHVAIPYFLAASGAMLVGVVSASVPLLAMLDSRFPVVNRELLWVGFWSLFGGAIGGVLGLITASNLLELEKRSNSVPTMRACALGGLVVAVAVGWFLSPKTKASPYGAEYDEIISN